MLLSFKVKNYLSFKDEVGFSMESNKKIRQLKNNKNILKLKDGENIWLNKTAIFYGANASGKTNILKGLDFLKYITLNSFKFDIEGGLKIDILSPFLLDKDSENKNIIFEIEFLIDKIRYKYFVELNEKEIIKEGLSFFEKNNEKIIIKRENGEVKIIEEIFFGFEKNKFNELNLHPRNNQTLISILANRDGKGEFLATEIIRFFIGINFINSFSDFTGMTGEMLKNEKNKNTILSFIKDADINIEDINQEKSEVLSSELDNFGVIKINGKIIKHEKIIKTEIKFLHPVYENKEKIGNILFNIGKQESQGTQKLFSLIGPILDTIKNNGILLIDEIDTHMHFLLIENLINFLHGTNQEGKNNIGNSQFIFNTHNLDLMDLELFKKDQIYFTSKDYYGAAEIYSLNDFKDIQIRNNSDIKKAYKLGAFGAIPILSDFNL